MDENNLMELAVRLENVDVRSRSNGHRIDSLEADRKEAQEMRMTLIRLTDGIDTIESQLAGGQRGYPGTEERPGGACRQGGDPGKPARRPDKGDVGLRRQAAAPALCLRPFRFSPFSHPSGRLLRRRSGYVCSRKPAKPLILSGFLKDRRFL